MRSFPRPRILVCDDEQTVRLVCERALVRAGYVTVGCAAGHEAIAAAERESYDAFILDVRMPDLEGQRVLSRLRALDPDAPCLVMSAFSDFDAAVELLRIGATDFLRKPFDVGVLVAAVDRILASTHLKIDSAVLAATQTIFSSLDAKEILHRVLGVARSLLRAIPGVAVIENDALHVHQMGPDDAVTTIEHGGARAILGRLAGSRDPMLLEESSDGDAELLRILAPGTGSAIAQPLMHYERSIGLLLAARRSGDRAFGERDARRATLLAGHVALALENGRLHAESQQKTVELERALDRLIVAERIATVSRLASGIGHEIANPTASVLAYLEIARDQLGSAKPHGVDDALARAQAGARSILDICTALRPLGATGQRPQHIDLRQVVDGALLLVSYELRGRARVVVEPPIRPALLFADPAKLGQVFLNLLLNAAQAIQPGSPRDHEVRITFARPAGHLVVRIHDTGPGVPPELREKIFEPSITTKTTGHGMGLAICRWILEEMGGTLSYVAESRGATFEVRLPVTSPEKPGEWG